MRIGNGAADQLQLDIYGEALDAVYLADEQRHGRSAHGAGSAVADMIDWLVEHWDQPEEGIWETRGGRKDFTYGRFQCWVALDRAIRIAEHHGQAGAGRPVDHASATGSTTRSWTAAWNTKLKAFTQHYDSDVLDSSLLLMPLQGFVAPRDPMWLSTLEAMDETLVSDSLVYRYNPRHDAGRAARQRGHVLALHVLVRRRAGQGGPARRTRELTFQKMHTYANHLGLYSEEIGQTGEQLGNFPQAFSHLALIGAAINLDHQLDHGAGQVEGLASAR